LLIPIADVDLKAFPSERALLGISFRATEIDESTTELAEVAELAGLAGRGSLDDGLGPFEKS
jgi:hypothetical protein